MIPQHNDPCLRCKYLKKEKGVVSYVCELGRYESASMIIFGYCGFFDKKKGRPLKAPFTPSNDD